MTFGTEYVLITVGGILTAYVLNNALLKEGVSSWFVSRLGINTYKIQDHSVKETLKKLKYESKLTEFDNVLKTELYHYYVELVIDSMNELVTGILDNERRLTLDDTKKMIKNLTYDKLTYIENSIDMKIKMPDQLQEKFDKLRNYLSMQQTYAIENAMHSSNKIMVMVQVMDAIDNNMRWFLFVTTEMFENYNGYFDSLTKKDIFIKKY